MEATTIRPFAYVVRGTALNNGTSEVLLLTLNNAYDFIVDDIRVPDTNGLRVSIKFVSGEEFMNAAANCALIAAASDNYWKVMPRGFRFPKNSQLSILFDNQSGSNLTIPTEIQFVGRLVN